MKWKLLSKAIRYGATGFIIYHMYLEAGLATALFAALITVRFELEDKLHEQQLEVAKQQMVLNSYFSKEI